MFSLKILNSNTTFVIRVKIKTYKVSKNTFLLVLVNSVLSDKTYY